MLDPSSDVFDFLSKTAGEILHIPAQQCIIRPIGTRRFMIEVPGYLHTTAHHHIEMDNACKASLYSEGLSFYGFRSHSSI
jgi:hypothetical protein